MRRSHPPGDVQPMLAAIAKTAAQLCEANDALIFLTKGDQMQLVARYGRLKTTLKLGEVQPLTRDGVAQRAILERRTLHVRDLTKTARAAFVDSRAALAPLGVRTMLATPLLRDGVAIGSIVIRRTKVRPFTPKQIALLKTFADQAAIAIENARLSQALEARNADLSEALEQQTATAEILRVISSSPTDIQPVLDTVAENAARLCEALDASIFRRDGDRLLLVAHHGPIEFGPVGDFSLALVPGMTNGRSVLEARTIHVADLQAEVDEYPEGGETARRFGFRTALNVPLIREGVAIGSISLRRTEVQLFTERQVALLQTFADQAVIAIENVRLFTELESRNGELRVALEQQTATSELLKVIERSTFDLQPVFETLAENAVRLCEARHAFIWRFDGQVLRVAAAHNISPELRAFADLNPLAPGRGSTAARAAVERRTIHIHDVQTDPEYTSGMRQVDPMRTVLAIPMLRANELLGVIAVNRREVRPFTDSHIALLETFADQAAIAIENARLLTELQAKNADLTEALEQQTATSEILRVISQSPTDVEPVFDIIGERAERLCAADVSVVSRFDGELIQLVALHGLAQEGMEAVRGAFPMRSSDETVTARAFRNRSVVHVPDVLADPLYETKGAARVGGYHGCLGVPMVREGRVIGVIFVARTTAGYFTDAQVELLKTFADQAVIAVENVRLFKELEARNGELTEALEQQTATSEILQVISSSPTDLQPVFDIIAESAVKLCGAEVGLVTRFDGELVSIGAVYGTSEAGLDAMRRVYPMPPSAAATGARAVRDCAIAHIPDVLAEEGYSVHEAALAAGFRAALGVPMLREGRAIGSIAIGRAVPGEFNEGQIKLLCTFADQAVIAVENVRLFKELEARTGELTQSVEQLTALGEVSQALSSTLDVEAVLDTIVSRATQLAGADGCAISEYDDATELFHVRATHGIDATLIGTLRAMPLRKGEGAMGRAAETREPTQIADIAVPGAYQSHVRDTLIGAGYRALLSVPLLREEQIIGSLSLVRKAPGDYPSEVIEVLKTFATQSALAIQNARLFREIADKSRQLEVASRHKSEFLANMSHELRTPLNAIIGFSEVLNERMFGELNEKQEEYLKDIHASGQHLLSLINDILDLSKIEAGRMELELTEFDLPAAVDNAVTLVRERASRKGVTVRIAIGDQVGTMRGDERKIRQVLLNLLSNAIKFTPEGGRIEVGAALDNGAVEVSVSDTGVGIAPEDQEAVFEEFRQVGASAAKQEGTGLGLALSRKFIELHGGTIHVTSEVGAGSTFTFRLPARE
jgi:GAF domain-containing protein